MKRKIIALLPFLFIGILAFSQSSNNQKLSKEEKKAARQAKQKANLEQLEAILVSKEFVIEAYTFSDRYGRTIPVDGNTNFVSAVGDEGVIQFAFGNGLGFNGLGGITDDGTITKLEIQKEKKGLLVQMQIFGSAFGVTDLWINVNADGRAQIRVTTLRGGRFRLNGQLFALEDSRVYQGLSTF